VHEVDLTGGSAPDAAERIVHILAARPGSAA
jgi:hypothetical protein